MSKQFILPIGEGLPLTYKEQLDPNSHRVVVHVIERAADNKVVAHAKLDIQGGIILEAYVFTPKRDIVNHAHYMKKAAVQKQMVDYKDLTKLMSDAAYEVARFYKDQLK